MLFGTLLGVSALSHADYGFVDDPDGFVNVRDSDSLKSKVSTRLKNGEAVSCSFEQGDPAFCFAHFSLGSQQDSSFIHKSRINFFKNFQKWHLTQRSKLKASYTSAQNKIEIEVQPAQFKVQDFKKTCPQGETESRYTHYKNKPFFGMDGMVSSKDSMFQLSKITIHFNGQQVIILAQNLEQYFLPNTPLAKNGLQDFEESEIYSNGQDLYIFNSLANGGAAQYTLMFHIRNGKIVSQQAWSEAI